VHVGDAASATITNSVLWNFATDVALDAFGSASGTYSCMQSNGWGAGTQMLTTHPFVEPFSDRLSMSSSCVNAGINSAVPADVFDRDRDGNSTEPTPADLAGLPRFVQNIDCGAYEKQ
jgi:hypothetical protein